MFIKFIIFCFLVSASSSLLACGGSNSPIVENLALILSSGLILSCFFLLPLGIIMFNTSNSSRYLWLFSVYFIIAVFTVVTMFFVNNNMAAYLSLLLCLLCTLPTFHTVYLAYKKRAAD